METFYPVTAVFLKEVGEQELEAIIPGSTGYVAVGNLGAQGETDEKILGCKTRGIDKCKACIALGIAKNIGCEKPKIA